jgi:hypothetical protein
MSQVGRLAGRLPARDWWGLGVVAVCTAALILYRYVYIEPRAWGVVCAGSGGVPLACYPRAALIWLQGKYLWGEVALALGLVAFLARGPFVVCVAAVVVGIAAVENYNATWGMVGAALGGWSWLRVADRGVARDGITK